MLGRRLQNPAGAGTAVRDARPTTGLDWTTLTRADLTNATLTHANMRFARLRSPT
ncbi:pentapeptide repeat-containing protein [Nonomuraea glycinis]|uniref:pentapeptide repeat-containing protein n=1 Tax=Nonomuraea glycinis TaxID=2047744 RepID=UPI00166DF997|nr:pentapeptide repeat-containing protein [Nonomuraea glycinis]